MSLYLAALQRLTQTLVGTTTGAAKSTGRTTLSHFRYATDDAAATVETAGYFNAAASVLGVGDTIDAIMAAGGTPVLKTYVVTVNTGSAVTIALQATTAG